MSKEAGYHKLFQSHLRLSVCTPECSALKLPLVSTADWSPGREGLAGYNVGVCKLHSCLNLQLNTGTKFVRIPSDNSEHYKMSLIFL